MTHGDVERRLRRFAPSAPRPALRDGVLRAAAAAVPSPRMRAGVVERLWFSRSWRVAWVAAVAVLVLAETTAYRHVERRFEPFGRPTSSPLVAVARELGLEPDWRATVTPTGDNPSFAEIWTEAR